MCEMVTLDIRGIFHALSRHLETGASTDSFQIGIARVLERQDPELGRQKQET